MKARMVTVKANGEPKEVELPCSIADFLVLSGLRATQVVVEFNGQVVPRGQLGKLQLQDGDQIEVIVPVAGG
jgi:thiamine biosynthesis protein ThiS